LATVAIGFKVTDQCGDIADRIEEFVCSCSDRIEEFKVVSENFQGLLYFSIFLFREKQTAGTSRKCNFIFFKKAREKQTAGTSRKCSF
jgi:hypothetical protein